MTVEPGAALGPIVLSDLQKSGHGHFPVMTKKGEPEGVLVLSDVSDIESAKKRLVVRDIMSSHISWVDEEYSLASLMQEFLENKQYIIFVNNSDDLFTGIITVADLLKHSIGVVKES